MSRFTTSAQSLVAACMVLLAGAAAAVEASVAVGEEVEVSSGAVTGLACALEARDKGDLDLLAACPLEEATREMVVFDVAEKQVYRLVGKLRRSELERAFGGGSLDFAGVVKSVKDGVATVEVSSFVVNPRPKPGAFKGCL